MSNIIKDLSMSGPSKEQINKSIKRLQDLLKEQSKEKRYYEKELSFLETECDKSLTHRVAVAEANTYNVLLQILRRFRDDDEMTLITLKTMLSLMTTQPDLLTPEGIDLIIKYFDAKKNPEIILVLLKWVKECCVKHEYNR